MTQRASERKYRRLFEHIQDGYYELQADSIVRDVSPSVERISGYHREELVGRSIDSWYARPEECAELERIFRRTGEINDYAILLRTKDGTVLDGLIARETADAIYLFTADRTEKRVARSAID